MVIGEMIDKGITIYGCSACGGLCEISINGKDVVPPEQCPYKVRGKDGNDASNWRRVS